MHCVTMKIFMRVQCYVAMLHCIRTKKAIMAINPFWGRFNRGGGGGGVHKEHGVSLPHDNWSLVSFGINAIALNFWLADYLTFHM